MAALQRKMREAIKSCLQRRTKSRCVALIDVANALDVNAIIVSRAQRRGDGCQAMMQKARLVKARLGMSEHRQTSVELDCPPPT
jgi:hypothetical protein